MNKRRFLKAGIGLSATLLQNSSLANNPERMIRHTSNPLLHTYAPENWRGTPLDESGRFCNLNHPFVPRFSDVLKWKSRKNPQAKEKAADLWLPQVRADGDFLSRTEDCLVWLGHASFFIRMESKSILIDPVFGKATVVKRIQETPYPVNTWNNIDLLLLSHDHRDHCDMPSLKMLARLNPYLKVFCGLGMKKLLTSVFPPNNIEEGGWYQKFSHAFPEIWFIPSRHWSKRGLIDTNQRLWGGFYIAGSKRIFFMGDSGYDRHFSELPGLHPEADFALMGVGAYSPDWFMHPSHMKPEDSWKAFQDLKAGRMIPMHFGSFDLSDEPASEPLRRLRLVAAEDKLILPSIGETIWL